MLIKDMLEVIVESYTEDDILKSIDEKMYDFVDDDWDDDYDSVYEWYQEHCTDEAEAEVLREVIYGVNSDISANDFVYLYDSLKDIWSL